MKVRIKSESEKVPSAIREIVMLQNDNDIDDIDDDNIDDETTRYDMLKNMDPPLGFGSKCPDRLAYKKLIRHRQH